MAATAPERNYKDSNFKKNFNIKTMKKVSNVNVKTLIKKNMVYQPDLVFYDENRVIFIEQSSNYTKKIHIGELAQFIDYVSNDRLYEDRSIKSENMEDVKFAYILILTPSDDKKLKKGNEAERLKFYWDGIFSKVVDTTKIEFIGVCDFKSIGLNTTYEKIKEKCEIVYIDK